MLKRPRNRRAVESKVRRPILIWDWSSNPITYDFIWNLFQVWYEFKEKGYNTFDLIIYTGDELKDVHDHKNLRVSKYIPRIENLIIPIAKNHSAVNGITVARSFPVLKEILDEEENLILPRFFSENYRPIVINYVKVHRYLRNFRRNDPRLPHLRISNHRRQLGEVSEFGPGNEYMGFDRQIKNKRYITLTLRDYGWAPKRNTTQDDIDKAHSFAISLNFVLVIVPDEMENLSSYEIPSGCIVLPEARQLFEVRVLVYSRSVVNLFVPAGPFNGCLFVPSSKSICVKFGASDEPFLNNEFGIFFGEQPYLPLNGYVIWTGPSGDYSVNDLHGALKALS